jgi:hypothetical protein
VRATGDRDNDPREYKKLATTKMEMTLADSNPIKV